jgi:hypothetical protein
MFRNDFQHRSGAGFVRVIKDHEQVFLFAFTIDALDPGKPVQGFLDSVPSGRSANLKTLGHAIHVQPGFFHLCLGWRFDLGKRRRTLRIFGVFVVSAAAAGEQKSDETHAQNENGIFWH